MLLIVLVHVETRRVVLADDPQQLLDGWDDYGHVVGSSPAVLKRVTVAPRIASASRRFISSRNRRHLIALKLGPIPSTARAAWSAAAAAACCAKSDVTSPFAFHSGTPTSIWHATIPYRSPRVMMT